MASEVSLPRVRQLTTVLGLIPADALARGGHINLDGGGGTTIICLFVYVAIWLWTWGNRPVGEGPSLGLSAVLAIASALVGLGSLAIMNAIIGRYTDLSGWIALGVMFASFYFFISPTWWAKT